MLGIERRRLLPPHPVRPVRVRVPDGVDVRHSGEGTILGFGGLREAIDCADAILRAATAGGPSRCALGVFRPEGDYWTVAFEGALTRLRDARGMRYLACLLEHPGREFCALDLAVVVAERPVPAADLGPVLDARARAAYRRRLAELREELSAAETLHDAGRVERANVEMEYVSRELAAAIGLSGRQRQSGSDLERARVAVTLRIRAAVTRIGRSLPRLARHLAASVETGRVCAYRGDRSWIVGVRS